MTIYFPVGVDKPLLRIQRVIENKKNVALKKLVSYSTLRFLRYLHKNGSLKFIYSEKATKFCEIFTADLTGTTQDKIKMKISQNFCGLLRIYEL